MDDELEKRLEAIDGENIALGIFVILIVIAYTANQTEKKYFVYGEERDKVTYYSLMSLVFFIVVLVNVYFVWLSYMEVDILRYEEYSKKKGYAKLSLIANFFVLIAAIIFLYISITDKDIDAEISL